MQAEGDARLQDQDCERRGLCCHLVLRRDEGWTARHHKRQWGDVRFRCASDKDVWTSLDYEEVMYERGVFDASGHSADGKYWRHRGIFGAAAQYYGQTREIAAQLDCVLDRVPIKLGS